MESPGERPEHTEETIRHFADLLDLDHEGVRLWTFASLAAEPRTDWKDASTHARKNVGLRLTRCR
jgi:hypothetical protein